MFLRNVFFAIFNMLNFSTRLLPCVDNRTVLKINHNIGTYISSQGSNVRVYMRGRVCKGAKRVNVNSLLIFVL